MSYKSKLAKASKSFKTAKQRAKEEGGFPELPDGKYMSVLQSCELKDSAAGDSYLVMQFKISDGEFKGQVQSKWIRFESEDDQVWLIRDLERFGIQLEDLSELEEVAKLLNDSKAEVKISLKTKDSGQFMYVDKVMSEIDAGDFAAEESNDDDEGEEENDEEDEDEDPAIASDDSDDDEEESDDEEDEAEEDEEEEEESDEAVKVGMEAAFEGKGGKEIKGKIIAILEETEEVKIKSGDKTYTVKAERLYIPEVDEVEEEEEEEEESDEAVKPAKKAVAKKKTASAPAKKAVVKKKTAAKKR